jgi:hypothetical protein
VVRLRWSFSRAAVVGAHLDQQRDRVQHGTDRAARREGAMQSGEREDHQVVAFASMCALVGQDGSHLLLAEEVEAAGADDDRGPTSRQAVRGHRRMIHWSPRRVALIAVTAYACLLFNLIGVNLLLNSLHSYAGL